jgi:hypothetical protein
MSEKELYDLALSDVPKYSLLNEILAIRDKRFPDEETDYTINVYGSISLDVLNKYVDLVNNWHELKKWLEDDFYWSYYEENMSSGWVVEIMKEKMQELENKQCHTTSE